MAFRVKGLNPDEFQHFFGLNEPALAAQGIIRCEVDAWPAFPDRITMQDLAVGETALLLNYEHLPVDSPYRSRHAIFIKDGADKAYDEIDIVPDVMQRRVVSLRGIDHQGHIVDAELAEGAGIAPRIEKLLANPSIGYIHAHYAKRGCFAAVIERA